MKTIKNHGLVIPLLAIFGLMTNIASAKVERIDTPTVTFSYVGNVDDQPVFQLNLNNTQRAQVVISVKDHYGAILYSERTNAKALTRNFEFSSDDLWDSELRVEVRAGKNNPEAFAVNKTASYSQQINVTRL